MYTIVSSLQAPEYDLTLLPRFLRLDQSLTLSVSGCVSYSTWPMQYDSKPSLTVQTLFHTATDKDLCIQTTCKKQKPFIRSNTICIPKSCTYISDTFGSEFEDYGAVRTKRWEHAGPAILAQINLIFAQKRHGIIKTYVLSHPNRHTCKITTVQGRMYCGTWINKYVAFNFIRMDFYCTK